MRAIVQGAVFSDKIITAHTWHRPCVLTALERAPRKSLNRRRDGRVAEGARLESVFRGNSNVGSNPTLSANLFKIKELPRILNPLSGPLSSLESATCTCARSSASR